MIQRAFGLCLLLCGLAVAEESNPRLLWTARVEGIQQGSAAVSDGQVFAPVLQKSAVVSLDAATGRVRWTRTLHDTSPFPPILDQDSVYVITGSCTLYRLARADGAEIWSHWLSPSIESMPTLSGGKIFAASQDSADQKTRVGGWHLACLDAATGKELWAGALGTDIVGAPLVSQGRVYVCTQNGRLHAFDIEKQREVWNREAGALSMPVPCRDRLVYRTESGLSAMRSKDGGFAWRWTGAGNDSRSHAAHEFRVPMISGDLAYLPVTTSDLACVSLKDRSTVWTWSGGDDVPGEPVMVGGRVYFGTAKGMVLGLNAGTGKKIWEIKTEASISDAPSIMDGSVYFHDLTGGVVCVDAGTPSATGWGMWGGSPSHTGEMPAMPKNVITPSAADGK